MPDCVFRIPFSMRVPDLHCSVTGPGILCPGPARDDNGTKPALPRSRDWQAIDRHIWQGKPRVLSPDRTLRRSIRQHRNGRGRLSGFDGSPGVILDSRIASGQVSNCLPDWIGTFTMIGLSWQSW